MKISPSAITQNVLFEDKFGSTMFPHTLTSADGLSGRYDAFPPTCEFLRGNIKGNYDIDHPNFKSYAQAWGYLLSAGVEGAITPLVGGGLTHTTEGVGYTLFERMHSYAQWLDQNGYAIVITPLRVHGIGSIMESLNYASEDEGFRQYAICWHNCAWEVTVLRKSYIPLFQALLTRGHLYLTREVWHLTTVTSARASRSEKFAAASVMSFFHSPDQCASFANCGLEQGASVEGYPVRFPIYGRNVYSLNGTPEHFEMVGRMDAMIAAMKGEPEGEGAIAVPSVVRDKRVAPVQQVGIKEFVKQIESSYRVINHGELLAENQKEHTRLTMRVSLSLIDEIAGIGKHKNTKEQN